MSRLKRKKEGANKSSANLFTKNSVLLPVTRQKIVKLCENLKRDKLTPWIWFNSRGVKVTDFYGKTISMLGGLYGQSAANVFFDFIVLFLQDAIVKTLDETLEICLTRKYEPEPYIIRETAMLLDGYLIDPIYRYMADIDRRLRGRGNPKSVGRKNVTEEIAKMVKFLDKCKDEMIQGIKAEKPAEPEQKIEPQEKDGQAEPLKEPAKAKPDSALAGNINIQNFQGILGDVQAENVQTGDHAGINKHDETEKEKKGIVKKLFGIIAAVVIFLAALLTCLYYLGWLEPF